jgi:hypothetical protein
MAIIHLPRDRLLTHSDAAKRESCQRNCLASAEAAFGLEVRLADYISQPVRHASGELQ